MSAGIPYFNFYPANFMHGVRGMSAHEVGVYTMILCRIYEENGPVAMNEMRLATYCGMRVSTFRGTLKKLIDLGKITLTDGMIFNEIALDRKCDERSSIPIHIKRDVWNEGECAYCGEVSAEFEIDHIHPWSRGGTNDRSNLTLACRPCNRSKRDKTVIEWMGGI